MHILWLLNIRKGAMRRRFTNEFIEPMTGLS
ncbi:rCG52495 [Rattus norvegicus]|uniref:RCG52495 n=1 Tax=Rattus norvegicus TaxID=10116 RepID=A6K103_RAT|nr:rCG52495 [Rattus norvegicus]